MNSSQKTVNQLVSNTREKYLTLKSERDREYFKLNDHLSTRPIDTAAIGKTYARIVELSLQILNLVVDFYKKREAVSKTRDTSGGSGSKQVKKMMAPPDQTLTPDGGGSGGGSGHGSAPVCEGVADDSDTMAYVCTSTVSPSVWTITWKSGGYTRYQENPPLAPMPLK